MPVELSPRGTRGLELARPLRAIVKAGWRSAALMFRLTGGRLKVQGRPLLALTTIGAKSGLERHHVLSWFPDKGRAHSWLVVGSNLGDTRHPAWCHNLAKNPDRVWVEVEGKRMAARAQSLAGTERENAWSRVVELSPTYERYAAKTDRVIPVIRLEATHPHPRSTD